MTDTLRELLKFLESTRGSNRIVVWAHNSHLGDARATELGDSGELNVGQLVREDLGAAAVLVGFTTAGKRTTQPLLPGAAAGAVRLRRACRYDQRA